MGDARIEERGNEKHIYVRYVEVKSNKGAK